MNSKLEAEKLRIADKNSALVFATDGNGDGKSTQVALLKDQLLEARDAILKLEEEKLRAADENSAMERELLQSRDAITKLEAEKLREQSAMEQELLQSRD